MSQSRKTLLLIDDDTLFRDSIASFFHQEGVRVTTAGTGAQGLAWLRSNRAEVVLLDQRLPDCSGTDLCREILSLAEQAKIIFITAFPSFDNAVQALRNGAWDYLSKPFELEELKLAVSNAFRTVQLEHVERVQQFQSRKESASTRLLGISGGLSSITGLIEKAATSSVPVLITGETGTGKTVVAKKIHYLHHSREQPFIDINCAALPENLIESELFGHEKGAFTGAAARRTGLFEMADGGTLFLDEIGEMPVAVQSKLLGVLDNGTFRRLGGQNECMTGARVIAATNIELEQAIERREFRQDLYFRLGVLRIHLPPLRLRVQDIPELTAHFISAIVPDRSVQISGDELGRLAAYSWPGNVRELRNIIERAILLRDGEYIHPSRLIGECAVHSLPPETSGIGCSDGGIQSLEEVEKRHIQQVLHLFDGNRTRAAQALGVARSTLLRKIEQFKL